MASHVEVVSTDFRRVKVKVTPGTYMIDVLNEACEKLHLSSDKYLLKYKQKNVDLTGPFRTSGLSAGAKLELVVKSSSPSVVSIKLDVRVPDSGAPTVLTKKLPSSMALWQVLRQFEAENKGLILTARGTPRTDARPLAGLASGQLYHEAPVVSIMGREYTTLADLQKTLSQCGINSGSVLLRVELRPTDKPLQEAMEEISLYFKDVEEPAKGESGAQPAPEQETKPEATSILTGANAETTVDGANSNGGDAMDVDTAPAATATGDALSTVDAPSSEGAATANPLQPSAVFLAPTSSTPAAALIDEPDSVYEPTVAMMQQRQQALQARSHNTRLKSDAELAAEQAAQAARLAEVRVVTVKIRFPDMTMAQWTADQSTTGAFLYAAVRAVMSRPAEPFRLVLPGPGGGTVEDSAGRTLIAGYRFRGNVLLHLLWEDGASEAARKEPFLRADVAGRATEVVVPDVASAGDDVVEDGGVSAAGGAQQGGKEQKKDGSRSGEGLKVPKWLKLPGKK